LNCEETARLPCGKAIAAACGEESCAALSPAPGGRARRVRITARSLVWSGLACLASLPVRAGSSLLYRRSHQYASSTHSTGLTPLAKG